MPDDAETVLPRAGERSLIIGATGSGKTGLMVYFARRLPSSPIIIYDTKIEPKYATLPKHAITDNWAGVDEAFSRADVDYIIFQPDATEASDPEALDAYLLQHYDNYDGVPAVIDEVLQFQVSSRAGPGLTAMLTRGRSRGITTVMGTQRPAYVSGFVFSETQAFYVLQLVMETDRKRVANFIPGYDKLPPPSDHAFYYYRAGDQAAGLRPPVKLDKGVDTGYTIGTKSHRTEQEPAAQAVELHHWL